MIDFLEKRNLWVQYKKAKKYILLWKLKNVDFRLREPKKEKVYYFKINNQFRAWWKLDWNIFKIRKIDNHQD